MSGQSVLMSTLSNWPQSSAAWAGQVSSGRPLNNLAFFLGMRLLPPRAKRMALTPVPGVNSALGEALDITNAPRLT